VTWIRGDRLKGDSNGSYVGSHLDANSTRLASERCRDASADSMEKSSRIADNASTDSRRKQRSRVKSFREIDTVHFCERGQKLRPLTRGLPSNGRVRTSTDGTITRWSIASDIKREIGGPRLLLLYVLFSSSGRPSAFAARYERQDTFARYFPHTFMRDIKLAVLGKPRSAEISAELRSGDSTKPNRNKSIETCLCLSGISAFSTCGRCFRLLLRLAASDKRMTARVVIPRNPCTIKSRLKNRDTQRNTSSREERCQLTG